MSHFMGIFILLDSGLRRNDRVFGLNGQSRLMAIPVKCAHEHQHKTRTPSQSGRHHSRNDRHPTIREHRLGSDGGCRTRALLHARPQHQIQLEVFTQDALGEEKGGRVVFATRLNTCSMKTTSGGAWLLPIHRLYNHGLPLAGAMPDGYSALRKLASSAGLHPEGVIAPTSYAILHTHHHALPQTGWLAVVWYR